MTKNKSIHCAVILAATVLAAACAKDGKYNPGAKISKVYESVTFTSDDTVRTVEKHLTESWTWDGNKLQSITYAANGALGPRTVTFEYDGSQISKVVEDNSNYAVFEYDGRRVNTVKEYVGGTLFFTYTFSHKDSKIDKIERTRHSDAKAALNSLVDKAVWTVAMPCDIRSAMQASEQDKAKNGNKRNATTTFTLTWDGMNVGKVEEQSEYSTDIIEYKYDNKKNPMCNFLYLVLDNASAGLSKNNVLEEKHTSTFDGEPVTTTVNISYRYDGMWPVEYTATLSYADGYASTTYYEYED